MHGISPCCCVYNVVLVLIILQVILPTSCDGRTCVECVKGLSSSPEECRSLNCSETVVLIDEVDNQEYTIDGIYHPCMHDLV